MSETCPLPAPAGPKGGPVQFAEVGKHARDLLHKGFIGGHLVSISCLGPCGATLTSTATIVHDVTVCVMSTSLREGKHKRDLSFSTLNNKISAATMCTNCYCPGLTVGLQTVLPGVLHEGKVQVQYQNECSALSTKVHGLKGRPEVEVSLNAGCPTIFAGGSAIYDTLARRVVSSKVGVGYSTDNTTAAMLYDPLIDKCVDAYFTRTLLSQAQIGGQFTRLMEGGLNSAKFGGSYSWDQQTVVKGRVDHRGMVAGLLEFSPSPLVTFGLLTSVNLRDVKAKPQIGLSMSVLASKS